MNAFTPDQLGKISAYARMLAAEEMQPGICPISLRPEQREEATEALTRWLFDHRLIWAPHIFEEPRRLGMPDDPDSPWPIVARFFKEHRFDANGHAHRQPAFRR